MKVILLNGPPGSGKDTFADFYEASLISQGFTTHRQALADLPKKYMAVAFETDVDTMFNPDQKDVIWAKTGSTSRELLIAYGEARKGSSGRPDYWAARLLEKMEGTYDVLLVTDVGFQAEYDFFDARFDTHLFQLHRPSKDYSNDSRTAVTGHPMCRVGNDGTYEDLKATTHFLCQNTNHKL